MNKISQKIKKWKWKFYLNFAKKESKFYKKFLYKEN